MIYEVPNIGPGEAAALERIGALGRELRHRVAEPRRWVGSLRRVLGARAIRGSNSIEGFEVSVEDALAAVEGGEPTEAQEADWLAVSGYRRAMTYVLQLARDEHFEYSASLIRSLHFIMTEYTLDAGPGLWRPGPIWVRNDLTGDLVYEGPEHDSIPELIEELTKQLAVGESGPAMVQAAMAHLNLAMIHPFRDGNGRMARCLQTLVLARERVLSPEWLSIEEFLGANTPAYYDILSEVGKGSWRPDGDARPWVRFCLRAHYIQVTSVLRRIRESEGIWIEVDGLRQAKGLPERVMTTLHDAAIGLRIRNASHRKNVELSELTSISNQVATNDLRSMVQARLLEQRGSKRGSYYIAAGPLLAARQKAKAGRTEIDASALFKT